MITTEQIKALRDETGVSVMQCKKALEEAKGDGEKALIILRKRSADIASKKSGRTLGAGAVAAYIHGGGSVGAMVELACETDFVGRNEEFKKLAYDIAMQVAATSPEYLKKEEVTVEARAKVAGAFEKDAAGKPAEVKEKILEGKLTSYFAEKTLLEQPFIKNQELTVAEVISAAVQKFGEKIEIVRFTRFSVGS